MAIHIGIVGLPNVGKSTLFNALTQAAAESANFPFCTIEPNVGTVDVPDERLEILAKIFASRRIVPTTLQFVDIAGLVKGAAQGEGLGNQFLAHIRQVDAIAQVVRCFADDDIVHVDGSVNPVRDLEVIEAELMLADLQSVQKRQQRCEKLTRAAGKEGQNARAQLAFLGELAARLGRGEAARTMPRDPTQAEVLRELSLLTDKPMFLVANVAEADAAEPSRCALVRAVQEAAEARGLPVVAMSAAIEAELGQLAKEERGEFLASMGLEAPGLNRVITAGYQVLERITFLTAGPQETRAWDIAQGTLAPAAAGSIHSDLQRGFIRAEVMRVEDLVALGSEAAVRAQGQLRSEGKDYVMRDGDVVHFRFNV